MDAGQVGNQNLGGAFAADERVTLNGLEQIDDASSCRPPAGAAFRIERQGFNPFALHRLTQLAFQQCFKQQGKEVDRKQGLDTMHGLQIHGRHLEVGLQLREPLLDDWLPLIGFQEFQF